MFSANRNIIICEGLRSILDRASDHIGESYRRRNRDPSLRDYETYFDKGQFPDLQKHGISKTVINEKKLQSLLNKVQEKVNKFKKIAVTAGKLSFQCAGEACEYLPVRQGIEQWVRKQIKIRSRTSL